jgi:Flp pilus assembly secretin CpaC
MAAPVVCVLESVMSAVFGRYSLVFGVLAAVLLPGTAFAQADSVSINLDQAKLIKIPERTTTIVIGNPLVADAALQSGGLLVVTGKGYGVGARPRRPRGHE